MPHPLTPDLVTCAEAAVVLPPGKSNSSQDHLDVSTVHRMTEDGRLTPYFPDGGGRKYVSMTEVRAKYLLPLPRKKRKGEWVRR